MCLFLYVPGDELLERENGASDDCCCRDIKVSMCSSFCVLIHNNGSLKINYYYYSVIRGFHAEKLPSFPWMWSEKNLQVIKMALRIDSLQSICITQINSKQFNYDA